MGGSTWTWMVLCCALLGACGPPQACEEVHGESGCPQDFDVKVAQEVFDLRLEIRDIAGMAPFAPTGKGKVLLLRKGTEEVLHRIETEAVAGRSVRVVLSQAVLRAVAGAEVELMLFMNGRRSGRSRIALPLVPVFALAGQMSEQKLQSPQVHDKKILGVLATEKYQLSMYQLDPPFITPFGPLLGTPAMGLVSGGQFVGVDLMVAGMNINYFLVNANATKIVNLPTKVAPQLTSHPARPLFLLGEADKLHAYAWASNNVTPLTVPAMPADARLAAIYPSPSGPAAFLLDTQGEIHVLQSQNQALTVDESWTQGLRAGLLGPRSGWLAFTLGDVNGDGVVDLAYADGQGVHFVLLDPEGKRVVPVGAPLVPTGEGQITGLALGDLMGSSRPELVVARRDNPLLVYLNDTP